MPTLEELEAVARGAAPPPLDDGDRARIAAARGVVEDALRSGRTVYGVNTGFGDLVTVSIAAEDTAQLQLNLIRSHAVGSGAPLDEEIVRAMVFLLAGSLRRGRSGVRGRVGRTAARPARARRHAGRPEPRLGRLLGRPRAARAPRARARRRGRGDLSRRADARAPKRWRAPACNRSS